MRRLSPTLVFVIAGVLALALIAYVFAGGGEDSRSVDRLSDQQAAGSATAEAPQRCASQRTNELIKRELFRRAAQLRGADQAAFERVSAYAVLRVDSPRVRSGSGQAGTIQCAGSLALDLPPGFEIVGGRRTLAADAEYAIQPGAGGGGDAVTIGNADSIIVPLATLARLPDGSSETVAPESGTAEQPRTAPPTQAQPSTDTPATKPAEPARPRVTARPSFNCQRARTRGEIAVCGNAGLASLDRQMAAQFNRAMSRGSAAQRARLQRTRARFLSARDSCRSVACMADAYRARMREIAAIAAEGGPAPPPAAIPTVTLPPPSQAGPSFNCQRARTRGEIAVCTDPGLASLDRQMAAQFGRAIAQGTGAQRELLESTRIRFLRYRDACRSSSCIARTYRTRMREIADIVAGRWKVP